MGGIPVNWRQITNAKVIVEVGMDKLNPDPSFGSHFFQNVTSLRIGYFTISKRNYEKDINWDWLTDQPHQSCSKQLKLIELDDSVTVQIDGSIGEGVILKPVPPMVEQMDEELSPGI